MSTLPNGRPQFSPTAGSTMRATIWNGVPYQVDLKSIPKPQLKSSEDAIVRLTSSAICGSDLHIYHGLLGSASVPWVLGHEGVGIVQEVGEAVQSVKPGDRVIVSDIEDDGVLKLETVPNQLLFGVGSELGVGKNDGMQGKWTLQLSICTIYILDPLLGVLI
jgi:threonine dehydrogenase-like Zn-dependent dehydrogenase